METISRAYISGSLERAYFQQNGAWLSIEEESHLPNYCSKIDIANLLSFGGELIEISEQTDLDALKQRLTLEIDKQKSLSLAIDALSVRFNQQLREESLTVLQLYFDECNECYDFVRRRLLSNHNFEPTLIEEAITLSPNDQIKQLYADLLMYLESIEFLNNTWTITAPAFIEEVNERDDARFFFIDQGTWESFTAAIYQGDIQKFESESVKYAIEQAQNKWVKQPIMLFREMENKLVDGRILEVKARAEVIRTQITTEDDPIIKLIQDYLVSKQSLKDNKKRKRKKTVFKDVFEIVKVTKDKLVEQIKQNKIQRFKNDLKVLLKMQMENSEPEHIVKTLTDLSSRAIDFGKLILANELVSYSEMFNVNDAVILSNKAKVLRGMNRLPEALLICENAYNFFRNDVFTHTGKAELLKAMNRLPEALSVYEKANHLFPEEVVTYNGKAEVLKAMNRLPEALSVYEIANRLFPDEVFTYTGRAEVLKAMNRLPEALSVYKTANNLFSDNSSTYNGKAEVLKAMNRLPEALSTYEEANRTFPYDVVTYAGKAEVLKAMNRLPEALSIYENANRLFSAEVVTYTGMAEVLKAMNRLQEALSVYENANRLFPEKVVTYTGKAETLKALNRLPEALAVYENVNHLFPADIVTYTGKAETLKAFGDLPEALSAYEIANNLFPYEVFIYTGKAEVLKAMNKLPQAEKVYKEALTKFPYDSYVKASWLAINLLMENFELVEKEVRNLPYPVTNDDWVMYHISAMYYLKIGDLDEAQKRLEYGIANAPIGFNNGYFKSSLSLVLIKQNHFKDSLRILLSNTEVLISTEKKNAQEILLTHSYAGVKDKNKALRHLHNLDQVTDSKVMECRNLLSERYSINGYAKTGLPPEQLDERIAELEFELVLA